MGAYFAQTREQLFVVEMNYVIYVPPPIPHRPYTPPPSPQPFAMLLGHRFFCCSEKITSLAFFDMYFVVLVIFS